MQKLIFKFRKNLILIRKFFLICKSILVIDLIKLNKNRFIHIKLEIYFYLIFFLEIKI